MPEDEPKKSVEEDGSSSSFVPEAKKMMIEQLRKLQHHSRTNVPAEMAQKAKAAFNVGAGEAEGEEVTAPVNLLVYPQDPFVSEPEIREMNPSDVRLGLRNSRVIIRDSKHETAQPDENNNYLYWKDQPAFNQVNAFYYVTLTLRMYEKFAHRQIPWAFTAPRVNVDPHAGEGMNAFYDEDNRTIGFFNFVHADGEVVNTAQSADVVAHEAGHAILDGLRDLYNQSFGMGPISFHESFADMSAVLVALHDDELVRRLLEWTENDLRVDNFVSKVAERIVEQMERATSAMETIESIDERTIYLRNALNRFTYMPFDDLPYFADDPRFQLGRESHNYSRLFTGAFYDALVNIYEKFRDEQDVNPHIAVYRARDAIGHILAYAVECGPVGELTFADMARAFLTADHILNEGEFHEALVEAFEGRGLLSSLEASEHMVRLANLPSLTLPTQVDSALDAGIYLVEEVIPTLGLPADVEYTPMSAHRNKKGYAFLTYFTTTSTTLEGKDYRGFDGVSVDVFGGLTLAFDPEGALVSALHRPVTDEDIRKIQILTKDLIEHGLVTETTFMGGSRVLSDEITTGSAPSVQPRFLYMVDQFESLSEQVGKLVRDPMILDHVPLTTERFLDYLKRWLKED